MDTEQVQKVEKVEELDEKIDPDISETQEDAPEPMKPDQSKEKPKIATSLSDLHMMIKSLKKTPNDHNGIGFHGDRPRDYKILRFYDGRSEDEEGKHKKYYEVHVEIFDTKTQSWKKLEINLD